MVDDARYKQKNFMDDNTVGLTAANILKDDNVSLASYITCFGKPNYSLQKVFIGKEVDAIFNAIDKQMRVVKNKFHNSRNDKTEFKL